MSMYWM